jgi:oxygen-independent coproporphyrinogen-3 oxidase
MNIDPALLRKYNVPIPRYTSYPTVPFWKEEIDVERWKQVFKEEFLKNNLHKGIGLYVHLPFCESLCTYCGCNKKITNNHGVEEEYIEALTNEWNLYRQLMGEPPILREIHLGGGTPTFFSPSNLALLIESLEKRAIVHPHHEFSIEGHPNNTTKNHLKTLYDLGFRRISYGVQDHNLEVQQVINRIQPVENVRRATEEAREVGFKSVNFDLIFGLPKQSLLSIEKTIQQTIELKPDRIAFYSYAHVPWTSRGQRLFDENDLPSAGEKLQLYLKGRELLTIAGYVDIGMDHFALPGDDLYLAWLSGKLHRNFMGYTAQGTSFLLGLGVSSICDAGVAFAQNRKSLHEYYEAIQKNELAIFKGYFLNKEDISFRKYILNVICNGYSKLHATDLPVLRETCFPELKKLSDDGLIEWNEKEIIVTSSGRHFIRNISSAFDLHLQRNRLEAKPLFSKAI